MRNRYCQAEMKIIDIIGNDKLLDRHKTLFLCSRHAPFGCYKTVFEWVESLTEEDCVICFNTSELEEEVLQALLVAHVPTILISLKPVSRHTFNLQIEKAWNEKRLAVVVLERDDPKGTGLTPVLRNRYCISWADNIVCGYINIKGSIAPLLRGLNKEVTYLIDNKTPLAAESIPKHGRWTVEEDKHLLRLYYADMGIHTMHRELERPYLSIRQRVQALAIDNFALMGREFEDYVLELLFDSLELMGYQRNAKTKSKFKILEWRGDKKLGNVFPHGNSLPDLIIEVEGRLIAIECKWRKLLNPTAVEDLFKKERRECILRYSNETGIAVYLIVGVGGLPSYPEHLYFVNLFDKLTYSVLQKAEVQPEELKERLIKVSKQLSLPSGTQRNDKT